MSKLHELEDKAFGDAQLQRRQLIDTLEKEGFSRWDMSPEGHERFMKAKGEVMRTIKWDETANQYRVESADKPADYDECFARMVVELKEARAELDALKIDKALDVTASELEGSSPIGCADKVEWRCFHCDEVFTDKGQARIHFGRHEGREPACVIKAGAEMSLLKALRRAEDDAAAAWNAISAETTDAAKAYYAQSSRHHEQLRIAEELGYERGLRDGASLQREALGETPVE